MDAKVFDFTWRQNRLSKDKETLKAQMLGVIKKNPARKRKQVVETGQAGTQIQTTPDKTKGVEGEIEH